MKIIYAGRNLKKRKALLADHEDIIVLLYDKWDDFGYQARNFMRDAIRVGHGVLFYRSSCAEPGIVGIAQVASTPYPDGRNRLPLGRYPVPIFSCILELVLSGFLFNRSVLMKTTS